MAEKETMMHPDHVPSVTKKFLFCLVRNSENMIPEAALLVDLGYELYADVQTANRLAHLGIPCRDFMLKSASEATLSPFEIVFVDIIDDAGRLRPTEHEASKLAKLRRLAQIRFEMNRPLLVQHAQTRTFVAWKKYHANADREMVLAHLGAVEMETQNLLVRNDLLRPEDESLSRTG